MDTSPFERICSLLRNVRPAEAARPLARYLENPNPTFRRTAALVMSTIGTQECIEPVKKALADQDKQVREYALIGLISETRERRLDREFRSGVFPALVPLLNAEKYSVGSPAKAMVALDSARAAPILESPQHFSVHNPAAD